mmetsp:Transcript_71690/g.154737  ORF Transcript_71690/g.154737 Transcript_71690/m.154737 type:complete len:202 (-) Transcript_71690:996-1601(-)
MTARQSPVASCRPPALATSLSNLSISLLPGASGTPSTKRLKSWRTRPCTSSEASRTGQLVAAIMKRFTPILTSLMASSFSSALPRSSSSLIISSSRGVRQCFFISSPDPSAANEVLMSLRSFRSDSVNAFSTHLSFGYCSGLIRLSLACQRRMGRSTAMPAQPATRARTKSGSSSKRLVNSCPRHRTAAVSMTSMEAERTR